MAGGKKTAKKLTPEEWLEQALVPVEEQPYAVPGNWCWTVLSMGYAECLDNFRKPVNANERARRDGDVPYYGATGQVGWIDDFLTNEQLVLVGEDGAPFLDPVKNKAYVIEGKAWVNNHAHILRSYYGSTGNFYLLNYLNCFNYRGYVNGTTRMKLTQASLCKIPVPVAPLSEQYRIVALIERLFNKLDEAKEKAQAVVDGFELRRSAVLCKAFSGELTEQWRQEHGVPLESWKRFSINSVCNSLKYGTAKKSEKTGSVVVIRMGNLQRGEIDWSDLAYSNDPDDIEKYHLDAGDVLFNRTNSAALVGKTSIYRGEYPAIYAGYLIRLDYKHDIITGEFLNYALNTNHAKEYCNAVKTDGVNQSNINAKKIGAYIIPVPTIDEQVKIVECLQNLLKKEQQAQKAAESVIDQIDLIKKAILSRAFRGELGTNDPKEENAENLLLKMFKEKDNVEHKIKPAAKDKTDTKTVHNFKSSLEETIYQFILNHPECTLSEMKSLSGNFSDINKALLHLKQNKKVQISNSKYRVIVQDEDSISSIQ